MLSVKKLISKKQTRQSKYPKHYSRLNRFEFKDIKTSKYLIPFISDYFEKQSILCLNEIHTTPFRRVDDDLLRLIKYDFQLHFDKQYSDSFETMLRTRKSGTLYIFSTSLGENIAFPKFTSMLYSTGAYRTKYISLLESERIFKVVWDPDIRIYLDKHEKENRIINEVVDRLLKYTESIPILTGFRTRFLKDPDDPNPVIIIEVQTNAKIENEYVSTCKKEMRLILSEVVQNTTSSKAEYIEMRAKISLIIREG